VSKTGGQLTRCKGELEKRKREKKKKGKDKTNDPYITSKERSQPLRNNWRKGKSELPGKANAWGYEERKSGAA